jgi:hypothetical protein
VEVRQTEQSPKTRNVNKAPDTVAPSQSLVVFAAPQTLLLAPRFSVTRSGTMHPLSPR